MDDNHEPESKINDPEDDAILKILELDEAVNGSQFHPGLLKRVEKLEKGWWTGERVGLIATSLIALVAVIGLLIEIFT